MRDDDLGLTYHTYDAGNRMTSVKNPFGELAYYEYTPGGRMTKRVLGNGCVSYYDYDAIGQVTKVDNRKSDLSVISSFEYERDPVGNPVSILREDGSVVYYEYDAKHQLTRETQRDSEGEDLYAWEWDYDAAGNRTYQVFNDETTYYEYNAANELTEETTDGVTTYYQYDRCGNTTAKQEPDGTTYYHWDYENLLTQIDLPDGAHNYFTYDADSKRVSKRDSEGYTEFIYQGPDMLKLLMARDEQGATQAHYTMGQGLEAMRRANGGGIGSGNSSFYHFDALGSTYELTDAAEDVTDTWHYDAWGEILKRTGSTVNPHSYVGKERYHLTPDPALYLAGVRYYLAETARFLTMDPSRTEWNPYAYAVNSPSLVRDPDGLAGSAAGSLRSTICRVVMWQGDTHVPFVPLDPTTKRWYLDLVQGVLRGAALNARRHLENPPYWGYRVQIITHGTYSSLREANLQPDLVGIATGSHGGCGPILNWTPFTFATWISTLGWPKTTYAAYTRQQQRSDWQQVARPDEFVAAYAGHCYSYQRESDWFPRPGPASLCQQAQASAMGIAADKVLLPSAFWFNNLVLPHTIYRDFRDFWRHFPRCCPLLYRDGATGR